MSQERTRRKLPEGGSKKEIVIAGLICALILLFPMLFIETEYRSFISEHGDIKEGAAGTGLLLAVVFRTVSRTVLRTIIRTSARAGMRASLKGAIKNTTRAAVRAHGKRVGGLIQTQDSSEVDTSDISKIERANYKSLVFASFLLYASWVVVIGLGQPYSALLNEADSIRLSEQTTQQERDLMLSNLDLSIAAHEAELNTIQERLRLGELKSALKAERDITKQSEIQAQIALQAALVTHAVDEEQFAKQASGDQTFNPDDAVDEHNIQKDTLARTLKGYGRLRRWSESTNALVLKAVSDYLDAELQLQQEIWKSDDQRTQVEDEFAALDYKVYAELEPVLTDKEIQRVKAFINNRANLSFFPIMDWIKTYPPFPAGMLEENIDDKGVTLLAIKQGSTSWSSLVIWAGGVIVVLPLWFMYFTQWTVARRYNKVLRHETGVDGGIIQLYFAGAFSFMPLTSDVIVDCDPKVRSAVALAGIFPTTFLAILLWFLAKLSGGGLLLFCAEAFMLYPMVQCFPLKPLEGGYVWRYSKKIWAVMFFVVMAMFMLFASEGLNNVI